MAPEKVSRCALQFNMKRRLSKRRPDVHPDEHAVEQDICDVTLWLRERYHLQSLHLWVERHFSQIGRQIAAVSVMHPKDRSEQLAQAAHAAFVAIGYEVEHSGADVYAYQACNGRHSQHETLQAYSRIQVALRSIAATG